MQPIRLIVVAVGGQGNLLASRVLGQAAMLANLPFRMSEIHGMAQRGGVVETAVVFGDAHSMLISDGEADILIGFEPCETLRALNKCHARTVVVCSTSPVPPLTVATGRDVYPDIELMLNLIRAKIHRLVAFDGRELARRAGSPKALNMVLIGALVQTGVLPVTADHVKRAMAAITPLPFQDINNQAFDLGFEAAAQAGQDSTFSATSR
jgi:indolepyruvate ferredoxin oxidoreductase beta subunit